MAVICQPDRRRHLDGGKPQDKAMIPESKRGLPHKDFANDSCHMESHRGQLSSYARNEQENVLRRERCDPYPQYGQYAV
ncbi:uncharacterized protein ANIA_11331 [Aspergillus nidulans FGSC A4]|uniref:Uncharacterized protein n=1 Tax=Emericella nidulans (strain FGSC A4 / ATCC 38163 / CBS 112.46 / NRRL 194 / M139) TaxID=227321 RepID=C8VMS0_EMENI|nr:hypothetical protein [Aspergillus nidulans FGSC A4]CBF86425.1 TPA: hypothetical protein ANIA_11331 [Aspergillus nidulans FGSC A4]